MAESAAGPQELQRPGRLEKVLAYGTARTAAEALLALRQLALAGVLGPGLFGAWALFRIIMNFYPFIGLGTLRALEVEVSRAARAEGDTLASAWGRTQLGFILVIFVPASIATAVIAYHWPEGPTRMALWGVAAAILLDRLWNFAFTYMRATGRLRRFAVTETLHALLQAVLTTCLALVWGLEGAFIGFVMASTSAICLAARSIPIRPAIVFTRLRRLVVLGFPLCLTSILTTALLTSDRLVVGALAGIEDLGRYAFAVSLASLGIVGATIIRAVVFPDVYSGSVKSGINETTRAHLEGTLRPFALIVAPFAGLGALALGPLVVWIVPAYADTVIVAQLFVFAGLAQGLATLTTLGIIAAGRQGILPLLSSIALVLTVLIAVTALETGLGLTGVAAGALIGRTAGAGGLIYRLLGIAGIDSPLRTSLSVILPLIWCGTAVAIVGYTVPQSDLESFARACVVYLVLLSPLVIATRNVWAGAVKRVWVLGLRILRPLRRKAGAASATQGGEGRPTP